VVTNEDYKILSDISYWIDSDRSDVPFTPNKEDVLNSKDLKGLSKNYKIPKVEDNIINGMQEMAVAPVRNGKADTSEVIIAYAGTNIGDVLDIYTDVQTVLWEKRIL